MQSLLRGAVGVVVICLAFLASSCSQNENEQENQNRFQGILEDWTKRIEAAKETDENLPLGLHERSKIFLALKQYDKALQDLNRAILINPDDTTAYHLRAAVYHAVGDEENATKDRLEEKEADKREKKKRLEIIKKAVLESAPRFFPANDIAVQMINNSPYKEYTKKQLGIVGNVTKETLTASFGVLDPPTRDRITACLPQALNPIRPAPPGVWGLGKSQEARLLSDFQMQQCLGNQHTGQ